MRDKEITSPSSTGSAPPESPVPAPLGTNGIFSLLQSLMTSETSFADFGRTTQIGVTL